MSPQAYLFPVAPLDPRHDQPLMHEPEPNPMELPSFLEGLCSAKCWTARKPRCNCRCGGRWHGKGRTGQGSERFREGSQPESWEEAS